MTTPYNNEMPTSTAKQNHITIKLAAALFAIALLAGCQTLTFPKTGQAKKPDDMYVTRVALRDTSPLNCYSHIKNGRLDAVSCETTVGIPVFSAGREQGKIVLDKTSPRVDNTTVQRVINHLTQTLFEPAAGKQAANTPITQPATQPATQSTATSQRGTL
ncbi:MAG: hypothetical protein CR974_03110 [Gammaproteobacteria bacterium]|nr:MAG: hypothetical protein CR974_03110 [Gammaproteobacteria bacterium]